MLQGIIGTKFLEPAVRLGEHSVLRCRLSGGLACFSPSAIPREIDLVNEGECLKSMSNLLPLHKKVFVREYVTCLWWNVYATHG